MEESSSISLTTLITVLLALILIGTAVNYMPVLLGNPDSRGLLMDFIKHMATTTVAP